MRWLAPPRKMAIDRRVRARRYLADSRGDPPCQVWDRKAGGGKALRRHVADQFCGIAG
jgi:hypothetical protein